jgi:hypothetical protein
MFSLNLSLTFRLSSSSASISRGGILRGGDESVSNERVKAIAEKIRRDNERQRKLLREEEERRQKIDAYAPQIWEDLCRVIESYVEGINDELKGRARLTS